MRKRALCTAAISGLLAIPAFSPVSAPAQPGTSGKITAAQSAAKPIDTTKDCPDGDSLEFKDCTDATFTIDPGERVYVRLNVDSGAFPADLKLVDADHQNRKIGQSEEVEDTWTILWTNKQDPPAEQTVLLKASPTESFHDGETTKVDVHIAPVRLRTFTAKEIEVSQNSSVVVNVEKNLTVGVPPIWISKTSKPKYGKLTYENGRKSLRYTPNKNFTAWETISYEVRNRRGEKATGTLTFVAVES